MKPKFDYVTAAHGFEFLTLIHKGNGSYGIEREPVLAWAIELDSKYEAGPESVTRHGVSYDMTKGTYIGLKRPDGTVVDHYLGCQVSEFAWFDVVCFQQNWIRRRGAAKRAPQRLLNSGRPRLKRNNTQLVDRAARDLK